MQIGKKLCYREGIFSFILVHGDAKNVLFLCVFVEEIVKGEP